MIWLPRHQKIKDQLLSILDADRLAHALLFRGPDGVGKREVARRFVLEALAKQARAQDMFGTNAPTGEINLEREHPDLIWIVPDEGIIRLEQVQELPKLLSYAPLESELRFVVLVEAEKLNVQAANAILKILEEPPPHTHFILTARDRSLVLPTIASRCQDMRFAPLSEDEMRELAPQDQNISASEGSLRRQEILAARSEAALWQEPAELLLKLWQTQRIPPECFALFERLESSDDALAVLESWQALARDLCLRLSCESSAQRWYHGGLATASERWVEGLSPTERSKTLLTINLVGQTCDRARVQIRGHVNHRLALESVLAQFARFA